MDPFHFATVTTATRRLLGVTGALLVLALAIVLFVRHQIRKSFPLTDGRIALAGLHGPVDIVRDSYGVPRITAADVHDIAFALGFVHAQDRFWEMDLARRAAAGRLAEIFGRDAIPFDRMFRIVGLRRIAERAERTLTPETRAALDAYAAGVNAYRERAAGRWPLECDLLRYEPEAWTPLHSLLAVRLVAWDLNLSWWTDMTLGAVAERVGLQMAVDIFPGYPDDVPPSLTATFPTGRESLLAGFLGVAGRYRELLGRDGWGGSNAVAVAARRSTSGHALLANDTHLPLTLPSLWYEVTLTGPAGRVTGFSMPGVPGVVVGRNDSIAWGVTNLMADEADYYAEQIDPEDSTRALFNGRWVPMQILHETIAVRGDSASTVTVRLTHNGPLVSDIGPVLRKHRPDYAMSMRWTGGEPDDPIGAFLAINRAHSWSEFRAALRTFGAPGQNFVFCDVRGNIGHVIAAKIPIRGNRSSTLPLPGWDPAAAWKGFVPVRMLPAVFNPREGFVASANNKVGGPGFPFHISDLWEPPSRIKRLREVLSVNDQVFSLTDLERLQTDRFSYHAIEVLPFVFRAFRDSSTLLPGLGRALEYFRNWNFQFSSEDVATTLFQAFFVRLLSNVFLDEMGPDLYHDYIMLPNIPIRVMSRMLAAGGSPWFDDTRTPEVENADVIVRRSLQEAIADLRERLDPDMKRWRWGELHTVTFRHLLGLRSPLDRIFNRGPYPFPGASTALISGEYAFARPFEVVVGPSFRMVVDMADSAALRVVLPPGQSGHAFHDHYDDQTELWLAGTYRVVHPDDAARAEGRLRLEPRR